MVKYKDHIGDINLNLNKSKIQSLEVISRDMPDFIDTGLIGISNSLDSIDFRIRELEESIHRPLQIYGLSGAPDYKLARKSILPITTSTGTGVYDTEAYTYRGTSIESGSATMKFEIVYFFPVGMWANNRYAVVEFLSNIVGTTYINSRVSFASSHIVLPTNLYPDWSKVLLSNIIGSTGIYDRLIYYIHAPVPAHPDWYQLYTKYNTLASVVAVGADGFCDVTPILSQSLLTEVIIDKPGTTSIDSNYISVQMSKIPCNSLITSRGISTAGNNSIYYFLGIKTYTE
jgi:hypothetical protein